MAEHHQGVVLILSQSQTVLRGKAVDLLVQLSQICTQRGIRLLLGNLVLILRRLGSAVGVKMVLLCTNRAVTGAVLRTSHKITRTSKGCQLLQNRNCSFADAMIGCGGGNGHQTHQQNESQQCAHKSLLHKLLLLFLM